MNVILRKTGNSTVIIIPHQIKETFGAEIREEIEFVTLGNNVIIRKAEPKFNFDKELEKSNGTNYDETFRKNCRG
ncbi:MAG: AbrB/MazE/SpoVT family DNA-binding domain-containing protein [Streptococcus sp.]